MFRYDINHTDRNCTIKVEYTFEADIETDIPLNMVTEEYIRDTVLFNKKVLANMVKKDIEETDNEYSKSRKRIQKSN